jgi:proteic killer suppression protein
LDITFQSSSLRKKLTKEKKRRKTYGSSCSKKIKRRLDDLKAAECLQDFRHLPGRCHELKGDLKGVLSLDVDHPYRMLFVPNHDPVPEKEDGGLDWTQVTAVEIIGIEDTHG